MAVIPGAPIGPPPAAHVQLQRHPDGRHAVLDAAGGLLGLHNSLASAQRHMSDYYEPQGSKDMVPKNTFQPPQQPPQQQEMAAMHAMAATQEGGHSPMPMAGQEAMHQRMQAAVQAAKGHMQEQMQGPGHLPAPGPNGYGGHPGPPTQQDMMAGMQFGQAAMAGKAPLPPGYSLQGGKLVGVGNAIQAKMNNQHKAQTEIASRHAQQAQQRAQQAKASGPR